MYPSPILHSVHHHDIPVYRSHPSVYPVFQAENTQACSGNSKEEVSAPLETATRGGGEHYLNETISLTKRQRQNATTSVGDL